MKLDILAFGAHPDDVELSCSGTLLKYKDAGRSIGVIDLTEGELGTRGTKETRREEAKQAGTILGLDIRENLDLGDGWFELNKENKLAVVSAIRAFKPEIIFANAVRDRHPDHGRGARLVRDACFLAGLPKVVTKRNGKIQDPWRPRHLFNYIQSNHITPDLVIDISNFQAQKMKSVLAYKTQFFNPDSDEQETFISSKRFIDFIDARGREMGGAIGAVYGEGFTTENPLSYDFNSLL